MDKSLPYWDASLPISERVEDLLSRMTLAEKAGQLFHSMIPMGPSGTLSAANPAFGLVSTEDLVISLQMTHFNLFGMIKDAGHAAQWQNRLQDLARTKTRLGIPITISTDPRNHFTDNPGVAVGPGVSSQWPETLGFAAIRDEKLVEKFADISRQEYIAIGLRLALHPQIDLATEYRWSRIGLTFGESADLSGKLGSAYIRGYEKGIDGGVDKKYSVSCMAKHFPGGGPQKDGEDPHFVYGKEQVYKGGKFDYHVEPFKAAIEQGVRWMMPYYGQPIGVPGVEEVGFAFNKDIITDLLKEKLGYKGIVCTDWGLLSNGKKILGQDMPARAWGAEHLTEIERVVKILDAGCDQFGGESRPDLVISAVEQNLIPESRIDKSVRVLLKEKFELGLFDNPFVDVESATKILGNPEFIEAGLDAQRRSITLLKNKNETLPLKLPSSTSTSSSSLKIYTEGIPPETLSTLSSNITPTTDPKEASIAIIRLKAPYTPRPGGFESFFHAGTLSFPESEISRLRSIFKSVPKTIVDVYLDRPAVLTPFVEDVITDEDKAKDGGGGDNDRSTPSALTVSYGTSSSAYLDVIFGKDGVGPEGKLPFDLPRSEEAVRESFEDMPFDTKGAIFRFGDGERY